MNKTYIITAIFIGVALVAGAIIMRTDSGGSSDRVTASAGTAVVESGVQYIDITARGGYSPKVTKAKAGVPTTIRMHTENTYDCSSALVIPALDVEVRLKATGVEEISVPTEKTQGTLEGMCSMGMYHFSVVFE